VVRAVVACCSAVACCGGLLCIVALWRSGTAGAVQQCSSAAVQQRRSRTRSAASAQLVQQCMHSQWLTPPMHKRPTAAAPQTSAGALDAIDDFTQRYRVSEAVVSHAVDDTRNVGFLHWRAAMSPKPPVGGSGSGAAAPSAGRSAKEAAAPEGMAGVGSGASQAGSFVADAIDVVLFSDVGQIKEVLQFRRPLASERREVLAAGGAVEASGVAGKAGGARAAAPAGASAEC
jgi:hypothetical protein